MVKHYRELRVYRDAFDLDCTDQWCISSSQVREDEEEYEASEDLTYPHTHKLANAGEKV